MFPDFTNSPPKRLTPRYCGFESRPFRVEPTPFLWAISASPDLHVGDLHFGELLTVPGVTAVSRAAGEPVDPDLPGLPVAHDLGRDLGAFDLGRAGLDGLAVRRQRHLVERHLAPGLGIEQGDFDRSAFFGPELLAGGLENGIRHRARKLVRVIGLVNPSRPSRPPRTAR